MNIDKKEDAAANTKTDSEIDINTNLTATTKTVPKKDMQARAWQITINNPVEKNMEHEKIKEILTSVPSMVYWCLCDEIGAEGTPHTHIFFKTRNAIRFSTLKNRFPTAHIEVAKGSPQDNRDYIRKEGKWKDSDKAETNLCDTFSEFGSLPQPHQGKRTDLSILFDMIENGFSNAEILRANTDYIKYLNYIERTRQALREEEFKNKWREIECIYVYGETNTNKTRTWMERYGYENVYRITNYNGNAIWDGYRSQDVVIFEEYRSQILISELLTWCEGYPNISLRSRFFDKIACFSKCIFISNVPLEEQYPNVQEDSPATWRAFLRRIQRVYHHKSKDEIIEYKSVDEYLHRNEQFHPLSDTDKTPFDKPEPQQEKLPFED